MIVGLAKFLLWLPCSVTHPTYIYGRKNIPKGKAIICCNHRSNFDIVAFYSHIRGKMRILAKKELFKNKFFASILRGLGGISVDRESNDIKAIKECMQALKNGEKLFIFPEGTRLKDETKIMGDIKGGTTMIAIKTQTPIVPVFLMQNHKTFRKSQFVIGEPFEFTEFYGKKLDEETINRANAILREKMIEIYENNKDKLLKKKKNK